jgi:hypothetical protein
MLRRILCLLRARRPPRPTPDTGMTRLLLPGADNVVQRAPSTPLTTSLPALPPEFNDGVVVHAQLLAWGVDR